jgi:ribosome-binding factor A
MYKRRFKAQFNKRPVKDEKWPCDDIREGDGLDPKLESHPRRNVANRKALQLCAQVMATLNVAFNQSVDDIVRDLQVEIVIPAPDSTQLLVTVVHPGDVSANKILESLKQASGWLRSEVAKSISRKRVPQIKYRVK